MIKKIMYNKEGDITEEIIKIFMFDFYLKMNL